MELTIDPVLEAAASREGVPAEDFVLEALRQRFLPQPTVVPRDEWERPLLEIGKDCWVSLPPSASNSEGLYD